MHAAFRTCLSALVILLVNPLFGQDATHTPGDSVVHLEVNFALDAFALTSREKAAIDSTLSLVPFSVMKQVEIYGHTDTIASKEYNRQLSKRRVQSILAYLVFQGLDPLKVKADYYGEEQPKYDYEKEQGHLNRRCEVFLVIDPGLLPPPEQKLTDLPFSAGDRIRIPNLNFVGNQPIPVAASFGVLEELLQVMRQYPDLEIELHGHVCCGNDRELSVERARMVYGFLAGNGIDPARMSYEGFSNTRPLFPERTDREKALNRRVEVYVLRNSGQKIKLSESQAEIDLRAPVLNVKFFPQKGRLYPSGHFMLTLIAEMINGQGAELHYEFVIFDNIGDQRLTRARASSLERTLIDLKVDRRIISVRASTPPASMPISENENRIMVKITKA